MSYADQAILTLVIQAQDMSTQVVDQAVAKLDGIAGASDSAGQALDNLQSTSATALGGVSDAAGQVVDAAGNIGPAFVDATDNVDTSSAIGQLDDLSTSAGDAGSAAQGMGQDFQDAAENVSSIDISAAFSGENRKAIKGAADVFDHLAGTNLKPVVSGLLEISNVAKPFEDTISKSLGGVFEKVGAKLAPLAATAGTVIGGAMAEAQALAATGAAAIGDLVAGIGAMSVPLAAEGTTVGTIVGTAIDAGIVAGLASAGIGAGIAIAFDQASIQVDSKIKAMSTDDAKIYSGSFADTIFTTMDQAFTATGTRGLLGPGFQAMLDDLAVKSAQGAGAALAQALPDIAVNAWTGFNTAALPVAMAGGTDAGAAYTGSATTAATTDAGWDAIAQSWIGRAKAAAGAAAAAVAEATMQGTAAGIADSSSSVDNEWKKFIDEMNKPFDANKEIMKLNGELNGKKLAEGLASTDPITRLKAETMREHIIAELAQLKSLGYDIGDGTGTGVATGIDNSTPAAVTQAGQLVNLVNDKLDNINTDIGIRVKYQVGGKVFDDGGGPNGQLAAGGPTAAHGLYEVTEGGLPELYTAGGRNYLLAGDDAGYVSPFSRGSGSSGGGSFAGGGSQINLTVNFSSLTFPGVAEAQRLAESIGPELVRWMRNQRVL